MRLYKTKEKFSWLLALGILIILGFTQDADHAFVDPVDSPNKPNIITIFIDDMGWSDLSSFGNMDVETPNIDKLAAEGISFDQFYVNAPICSPSRVAIATGTYPQRWNITSFLSSRNDNAQRGMVNWLDTAAPMLAKDLKHAGYATGHFGKWHMGGQRDVDEAPKITEYGFDESLTNFEGMGPKLLPLTKDATGKVGRIWEDAQRLGGPYTWTQRSEITSGFINAAMDFMQRSKKGGKPFFVNIWPDDVHSPFWPPFEDYGLTKADGKRALYLAVLEAMDKQFGKLFDYISNDDELLKNTLIIFCSDNGPEDGAGKSAGLKGYKGHLYEGGIRSSLIVWGPGFIDHDVVGTRNSQNYFSAIDLKPSILNFIGLDTDAGTIIDGENILPTLLGKTTKSRQSSIFWARPPDRKSFKDFDKPLPDLAVREGDFKLLCDFDGKRPELYDLTSDPAESNNLSARYPNKVKQMSRRATEWYNHVTP